jgi:hypothetical protein
MKTKRGNRNPDASRNRDLTRANEARLIEADAFAVEMIPHLKAATDEGCVKPAQRAAWLNEKGIKTQHGKKWRHEGIRRLVRRIIRLHPAP